MNEYRDGFTDGYIFAKEELVERLSEVEGLDNWTIDKICDLIENDKL